MLFVSGKNVADYDDGRYKHRIIYWNIINLLLVSVNVSH